MQPEQQPHKSIHAASIMPAAVTVMLTIIVCGLLYSVIFTHIGQENKELAFTLFGTVFALWGSSINYWIGTTRSSAVKSDIISGVK